MKASSTISSVINKQGNNHYPKAEPKSLKADRFGRPHPLDMSENTKKTHNKIKTKSSSTWNEMLSNKEKSESISFLEYPKVKAGNENKCILLSPQRILLYLVHELSLKLKNLLPDDKNVHMMLSEIQEVLKFIQSISTGISDNSCFKENSVSKVNSSTQTDYHNLERHNKLLQADDSSDPIGLAEEIRINMKTRFKEYQEKLVENCRLLESTCELLKQDNIQSSDKLNICNSEINSLKTEIQKLQKELQEASTKDKCIISDIGESCKKLHNEMKTLASTVSVPNDHSIVEDLKVKLQKSSERMELLEKLKLESDKALALTKFENEKLKILQKLGQDHTDLLENEIQSMSKLIQKQIKDIRRTSLSNSHKNFKHNIKQLSFSSMEVLYENIKRSSGEHNENYKNISNTKSISEPRNKSTSSTLGKYSSSSNSTFMIHENKSKEIFSNSTDSNPQIIQFYDIKEQNANDMKKF